MASKERGAARLIPGLDPTVILAITRRIADQPCGGGSLPDPCKARNGMGAANRGLI